MTNRRGFLGALIATAVLDPDRLLWVAGQKKIFIPKVIVRPETFEEFRARMLKALGHVEYSPVWGEPFQIVGILHPLQVQAINSLYMGEEGKQKEKTEQL